MDSRRRRIIADQEPLYKLPVIASKSISDSGRSAVISIDDTGLITFEGNISNNIRVRPDGTVYVSASGNIPVWFTVPDGAVFDNYVYDLSYSDNGNTSNIITSRYGRATGGGTYGGTSYNLTETSGDNIHFNTSTSPSGDRDIGAWLIQITNNTTAGVKLSFRIKLFINGVRYL